MKSKELIRQLQKHDPTGEIEVCIDNQPIYFIENLPAYYDGLLKTLIQDESKIDKGYSITGVRLVMNGRKLVLKYVEMEDVISENTDAIVDLSDLDPRRQAEWSKKIEDRREYWRKWNAEHLPAKPTAA